MEKYEDMFNPSFLKNEEKPVNKRPAIPCDATVTMAYIPLQGEAVTYDEEKALNSGTLFPSLNKEFLGGKKR